jgi:hypothetical protein
MRVAHGAGRNLAMAMAWGRGLLPWRLAAPTGPWTKVFQLETPDLPSRPIAGGRGAPVRANSWQTIRAVSLLLVIENRL